MKPKDALCQAMDEGQAKSNPPAPPNSSTEALATTAADPSPEQLHQPLIARNDSSAEGLDMAVNSTMCNHNLYIKRFEFYRIRLKDAKSASCVVCY
jgi:hypothetical protein